MGNHIVAHTDLEVYKKAFETAMVIFEMSKQFPQEEKYSLTDQLRRSSRSVCANLAEGWRKRVYRAAFIAKLVDAEAEAAETQVWLDFVAACNYGDKQQTTTLHATYNSIIGTLVGMRKHANTWVIGEEAESQSPRK
jgi:four helix bundle protein